MVDDISKLWTTRLGSRMIGMSKYCHAIFMKYFIAGFWSNQQLSGAYKGWKLCYFNTGVMVIDLVRWRRVVYTSQIEWWMEI